MIFALARIDRPPGNQGSILLPIPFSVAPAMKLLAVAYCFRLSGDRKKYVHGVR
jgi:hypothetical protein